jgi:hypothetical protein
MSKNLMPHHTRSISSSGESPRLSAVLLCHGEVHRSKGENGKAIEDFKTALGIPFPLAAQK